jgi:hypothetical protein
MLDHGFIMPTYIFWEAIFQTSKFITYSFNIQTIHILVHWNPLENREKIHNFFCHSNNNK